MAYEPLDYPVAVGDTPVFSPAPQMATAPGPAPAPASPQVMDAATANEIVRRLYQSELGRGFVEGDTGPESWQRELMSGALDEAGLLKAIRQSGEYKNIGLQKYGDVVKEAYQKELGRDPEATGLESWTSQLQSGQASVGQLPSLFSASPEGYVFDMYSKYLGRTPQAGESAGYISDLSSNKKSQYQVASEIRRSEEAKAAQDARNLAATKAAEDRYKAQVESLRASQNAAVQRGAFAPAPMPTGVIPQGFAPLEEPAATAPQVTRPDPFAATPINVPVFGPASLPTRGEMPGVMAAPAFNPFPNPYPAATPATFYSPNFFTKPGSTEGSSQ